jgi:hypothetical protein
MTVYYLTPGQSAEPVRQFMIILASVAAAAIILPELPSALWTIDAERIRNLIPAHQREQLLQELIAAESDDQSWNEVVWRKALHPLLTASRSPWVYIADMEYDINIHLDRSVALPGGETLPVTNIAIDNKSTRILPSAEETGGRYWVSMGRTEPSFQHEYTYSGCLARELLPMPDLDSTEWHQLIIQQCSARLIVEGELIELTPEVVDELPDLVRWYAPTAFDPPSKRVRVRMMLDYFTEPKVRTFTVSFLSYYCIGSTAITMKLYDSNESSIVCESYFGRALSDNLGNNITQQHHDFFEEAVFSTGRDSILWPGSGVHYRWEH